MREIEIKIDSLDAKGKGLAIYNNKPLLIEGALPGDLVKATLPKRLSHKGTKAFLIEIISHGIPRITPKCFYADQCGGCRFQDIDYSEQLKLKTIKIKETFHTLQNIPYPEISPIIPAPDVFYYRNKMEFTFSHKRWLTPNEIKQEKTLDKNFALGMHTPYTYDKVIDLHECFLQTPLTPTLMNFIRDFCLKHNITPYNTFTAEGALRFLVIRETTYTSQIMLNLITQQIQPGIIEQLGEALKEAFPQITSFYHSVSTKLAQVALAEQSNLIFGTPTITEKLGHLSFEISPYSFFQPNTKAAEIVYQELLLLAKFQGTERVLDLYCGVGTISLYVAQKVKKVVGFEIVQEAVDAAKHNQEINHIQNCEFFAGNLDEVIQTHPIFQNQTFDVLIVDPPRSGLHPNVIHKIKELKIPTVLYVSCNPSTQTRDLQMLCQNKDYTITAIQPIDMLPHTYHVENIVRLDKIP